MNIRALFLLQFAFIGGMAGLMSWALLQLLLLAQQEVGHFPVFDLFVYEGIVVGAGLGIFIQSRKVIFSENYLTLIKNVVWGILLGGISGFLGFLMAQSLLAAPMEIPLAWIRVLGWSLLGLWLGILNNWKAPFFNQKLFQILAGGLGGLLGGLFLEVLEATQLLQIAFIESLLSLTIFGVILFSSMAFIEIYSSKGYLRILTGRSEGKIFLLDKNQFSLGYQADNDIVLRGYTEVCKIHAHIIKNNPHYQIVNVGSGGQILVNFRFVDQQSIKNGDIIKLGTALLQYCEIP